MTTGRDFIQTTAGTLAGPGSRRQWQAREDRRCARALPGAGGAGADESEDRRTDAPAGSRHGDGGVGVRSRTRSLPRRAAANPEHFVAFATVALQHRAGASQLLVVLQTPRLSDADKTAVLGGTGTRLLGIKS